MPRWLHKILVVIHALAAAGKFRLTAKADRELATIGSGLDPEDVRDVLLGLTGDDFALRQASELTNEWMYVFKPRVGKEIVYLKLIVRGECVIVSFHVDQGEDEEDET